MRAEGVSIAVAAYTLLGLGRAQHGRHLLSQLRHLRRSHGGKTSGESSSPHHHEGMPPRGMLRAYGAGAGLSLRWFRATCEAVTSPKNLRT